MWQFFEAYNALHVYFSEFKRATKRISQPVSVLAEEPFISVQPYLCFIPCLAVKDALGWSKTSFWIAQVWANYGVVCLCKVLTAPQRDDGCVNIYKTGFRHWLSVYEPVIAVSCGKQRHRGDLAVHQVVLKSRLCVLICQQSIIRCATRYFLPLPAAWGHWRTEHLVWNCLGSSWTRCCDGQFIKTASVYSQRTYMVIKYRAQKMGKRI